VFLLYARGYATRRLEIGVQQDLLTTAYRRFHTVSYDHALKLKAGEALQRLTSDVPRCSPLIIKSFSELLGHIVLVLIVLVLMFRMEPLLAGISVCFVIIYAAGFRMYAKKAPAVAARRQQSEARYVAEAEEGLGALYSVRVQVGLRDVMRRFSQALSGYLREDFALYRMNLLFEGGFTSIITVLSGLATFVAGAWLIVRGESTVGTLVAFSQYLNWLYVFVNFMSGFAAEIEPAFVSLGRVQEVLTWPESWTVEEVTTPVALPDGARCAIEVRDLDFAIGDAPILRGLSLQIERGVITAVLGRSGLGKSTLLNILLGLYPVPPGKVFIFGQDAATMPLPERLGFFTVVEQEPRFLSGNVETAMGFSRGGADLRTVAEKLGMGDFLEELLSREISSARLSELSGGERKRLGILRGFLRDAPVLLLDEPTAFLDEATAKQILEAIARNFSGRTIVIFSHDPLVMEGCQATVDLAECSASRALRARSSQGSST
jgi:ATP-binding cassette subfamily B protein